VPFFWAGALSFFSGVWKADYQNRTDNKAGSYYGKADFGMGTPEFTAYKFQFFLAF